ncbi:anti-sigma factor domain-containing protein [Sporosarcina koreensis]|uniref:RsgI N-terminal anti-sigma domain-containing protein n=1 Tax=Sporosarcina koreensis TaxID=334735 RepID=A0ABW0TWX1_9BACL
MMRTYRGVVCEKKSKYMVFLTEKGEFLRGVPVGNPPEIGEEAEFTLVAPSLITGRKAKPRFVAAVLVAAALLFFFVSSLGPLNEKVMAYVQLDAGTAMEFGVNRKGNVISMRYLNEPPNEPDVLNGWEGHRLQDVLDKAVLGLSDPDKEVMITTIYPTRESEKDTRHMIGDAVQEVRVKHEELNLDMVESTPAERKLANKKKMSIHQFKSTRNEKKPVSEENPSEEKPEQKQKEALPKPKKEIVPPGQMKKQDPPAEKKDKKQNEKRSEKVPPHADKKGPPPHSSSNNKHNQGPPGKQKEHPSKEKKHNPHNNK